MSKVTRPLTKKAYRPEKIQWPSQWPVDEGWPGVLAGVPNERLPEGIVRLGAPARVAAAHEVVDRAARAYRRFCERNGLIVQQPNRSLSTVVGDIVTLANSRGPLASYRVTGTGRLRRVEDP